MKNKIYISILFFLAGALPTFAADAAPASQRGVMEWVVDNLVFVGGVVVVIMALSTLVKILNMMMKVQLMRIYEEEGLETFKEAAKAPSESFWSRLYKKATAYVPLESEDEILFEDHEYDGIRELDNNLPPWWVWMFYLSIVFGGIYMTVYHFTDIGMSQTEAYEAEVKEAEIAIAAYLEKQADRVDERTVTVLSDPAAISAGENLYKANACFTCHGQLGEGVNGLGPNLTDDYWINGGDVKDIFTTIKYGVIDKGMQSWKESIRPVDMQKITSYIMTLRGTNPPNAKDPEGELYVPEKAEADGATEGGGEIGMNN